MNYFAECGLQNYYSEKAMIFSPGYPNSYPTSLSCIYLIHSPPGSLISLSFISFELENSDRCEYDYLKARCFQLLQILVAFFMPYTCASSFLFIVLVDVNCPLIIINKQI
jgi:CUB domain